eukprot:323142-Chlamydomonas_euryale.AAC.1
MARKRSNLALLPGIRLSCKQSLLGWRGSPDVSSPCGTQVTLKGHPNKFEVPAVSKRNQLWRSRACRDASLVASAAKRSLSCHATGGAAERNWSVWGNTYTKTRSNLKIQNADKLVYIKSNVHSPDPDDTATEFMLSAS